MSDLNKEMLKELIKPVSSDPLFKFSWLRASMFKHGNMARLRVKIPAPASMSGFIDYPEYALAYHVWFGPWKKVNTHRDQYRYHLENCDNQGMLVTFQPIGIGNDNNFKFNKNIILKEFHDIQNPENDIMEIPTIIKSHMITNLRSYAENLKTAADEAFRLVDGITLNTE